MNCREVTSNGTVFLRRGDNPDEEELPVTAATFIEAFGAAYQVDRTEDTLHTMRAATDWFLGANGKSTAIYDFEDGRMLRRAHGERSQLQPGNGSDHVLPARVSHTDTHRRHRRANATSEK